MKIRKIVYNIDYVHILTFSQNYRSIIAPYFSYDNLEYAIDNENSIHEGIRLVFRKEGFALQFRKDGATLVYEGDIGLVKKSNPIVEIFYDIYEKIKKIDGYVKTTRHKMVISYVDIDTKENVDKLCEKNKYLNNPFGKLSEFAVVFEFENDGKQKKLQFGNYKETDISKFDLSPHKTKHNSDLVNSVGTLAISTVQEDVTIATFTKFKQLIEENEKVVNIYCKSNS